MNGSRSRPLSMHPMPKSTSQRSKKSKRNRSLSRSAVDRGVKSNSFFGFLHSKTPALNDNESNLKLGIMVDHSSYDGDSNAIRQSQKNIQITSKKDAINSQDHLNMILNGGINSGYGDGSRSSVVANVGGAAQFVANDSRSTIQPVKQVNALTHIKTTKKTKRRLLWRVGPLQKKKNAAQSKNVIRHSSTGSIAGESTAKSIKSFHTFHSESTAKVGNSQRVLRKSETVEANDATSDGVDGKMLGFIPSNLNSTVLENAQRVLARNRDALHGTPHRPPRSPIVTPESTKTADTVASSISHLKDTDFSDSETVMEIESQDEASGFSPRMIGFSLPESSKFTSNMLTSITTSLPSTDPQPRSTQVPLTVATHVPMTFNIEKTRDSEHPMIQSKCLMDDDISEADSEGPLWQLARLQAMSEGSLSPSSSNSDIVQSSMPSSSSVSTTQSDREVQTRHAERNLKAIHTLALRHLAFKEYFEAIEVFEEMLRGIKEIHGCDHYRVGTVLHNIATVYMKAKDYSRAADMCKLAIDIRGKALGHSHPHLSVSLAQLGIAHLELQNYREAVEAFASALIIRRKHLSPSDLHIARLLNNIGCAEFELNNYDAALKAFEEAIEIQRTSMRSTIPGTKGQHNDLNRVLLSIAAALCNIGSIKLRCRLYDQSLIALEEALLIQESVVGDNHATVLNTKESIKFVNKVREQKSQSDIAIVSDLISFVSPNCFHAPYYFERFLKKDNGIDSITKAFDDLGTSAPSIQSQGCNGIPKLSKGVDFKALVSDVMSLSKTDFYEFLEDVVGKRALGCAEESGLNSSSLSNSTEHDIKNQSDDEDDDERSDNLIWI